jgi:hypothetical protein
MFHSHSTPNISHSVTLFFCKNLLQFHVTTHYNLNLECVLMSDWVIIPDSLISTRLLHNITFFIWINPRVKSTVDNLWNLRETISECIESENQNILWETSCRKVFYSRGKIQLSDISRAFKLCISHWRGCKKELSHTVNFILVSLSTPDPACG